MSYSPFIAKELLSFCYYRVTIFLLPRSYSLLITKELFFYYYQGITSFYYHRVALLLLPRIFNQLLSLILGSSADIFLFFSTISSTLNALAAIILEDFIRPLRPNLSEKNATILTKIVSFLMGGVAIVLVLFARYFGQGILSVSFTGCQ